MDHFVAGRLLKQDEYKSFEPNPINRQWTIADMEVMKLLSHADRELGRLDMYSHYIPNIDLFISMHILKEATQSSKIEGTQTNIEEALLIKDDVPLDKRDDWEEVQNYIHALRHAITLLETLPFSSRLIRDTHKVLMQGVRGEHKQPGEFRRSQNWIGGATLKDAVFIPPVHTSIPELIGDIEKFVHNEAVYVPELIKIAIIHYQFETIHPFLDGNGRVGRLMITLYLVSKGILKKPILYLSDFLERHRSHYYNNLMLAREKNDLSQWLKFFLTGIIETAASGIKTFDGILQLQKEIDKKVETLGSRGINAKKVVTELYQKPIITADRVSNIADISMPSAYKLISDMERLDILKETTGAQRGRVYSLQTYINLFKS